MAINQTPKYEIPSEMRDFAERSVDQARKAFDGFIGAAHKAVETFEGSASSMQSTATDTTRRTLSYAEQNLKAAFDHAGKLVRAKDLQEAMQLQMEFARTQFASLQGQLKEFGDFAQTKAREASTQAASVAGQATAMARGAAEQAQANFRESASQTAAAVNRSTDS